MSSMQESVRGRESKQQDELYAGEHAREESRREREMEREREWGACGRGRGGRDMGWDGVSWRCLRCSRVGPHSGYGGSSQGLWWVLCYGGSSVRTHHNPWIVGPRSDEGGMSGQAPGRISVNRGRFVGCDGRAPGTRADNFLFEGRVGGVGERVGGGGVREVRTVGGTIDGGRTGTKTETETETETATETATATESETATETDRDRHRDRDRDTKRDDDVCYEQGYGDERDLCSPEEAGRFCHSRKSFALPCHSNPGTQQSAPAFLFQGARVKPRTYSSSPRHDRDGTGILSSSCWSHLGILGRQRDITKVRACLRLHGMGSDRGPPGVHRTDSHNFPPQMPQRSGACLLGPSGAIDCGRYHGARRGWSCVRPAAV
eukprot:765966-Hanusia_phi.AAC.8